LPIRPCRGCKAMTLSIEITAPLLSNPHRQNSFVESFEHPNPDGIEHRNKRGMHWPSYRRFPTPAPLRRVLNNCRLELVTLTILIAIVVRHAN
jgi:hypothetical protein